MISQLLKYDHATLLLYFGIVLFSSLFAHFSQRTIKQYNRSNPCSRKGPYLFSFFISSFFVTFSGVGADRINYITIFEGATLQRILHGSEPGFELIQYIFHLVIKSPEVFIGIISFWTICNIYTGLWRFKDTISLGMAIFIFTSQYYFQSFSLVRVYFAASILIRYAYLFREKNYKKYLAIILITCTLHYSVLFALIAYVLSLCIIRSNQRVSGMRFYFILAVAVVGSVFGTGMVGSLLRFSENAVISKYSSFLSQISVAGLGFKWIFNIIPYMLVFSFAHCFRTDEKKYITLNMGYMIVAVSISLLSYSVPVIGRGLIVINMPIIVILPVAMRLYWRNKLLYGYNSLSIGIGKIRVKVSYAFIQLLIVMWSIISMIIYLSEYMPIDGIDNYRFVWG